MATSYHAPLISFSLVLLFLSSCNAQSAAPAPSPSGALNLTAVLEKGSQYTSFIRLLKVTQTDIQINSQLNNSFSGMTVLAPTDNAFNNLKAGTLNSLSQPDQVALVLSHILPQYYTLDMFDTVSNPVRTQGSDHSGVYTVNITSAQNQVNVTTGVVATQITNTLRSTFPLAVYSVDKVLLPEALFGAKPPASPPPASSKSPKSSSEAPSEAGSSSTTDNAAPGLKWSSLAGLGLVGATLGALL